MTQDQPQRPVHYSNLTHTQHRAIECLLMSPTVVDAAKKAGVSRATLYRWLKNPAFRVVYDRRHAETLLFFKEHTQELFFEALDDLQAQLHSPDPQIRMQADETIMKYRFSALPNQEA